MPKRRPRQLTLRRLERQQLMLIKAYSDVAEYLSPARKNIIDPVVYYWPNDWPEEVKKGCRYVN